MLCLIHDFQYPCFELAVNEEASFCSKLFDLCAKRYDCASALRFDEDAEHTNGANSKESCTLPAFPFIH